MLTAVEFAVEFKLECFSCIMIFLSLDDIAFGTHTVVMAIEAIWDWENEWGHLSKSFLCHHINQSLTALINDQ